MISYELLGVTTCRNVCKVISDWTQPSPFLPYSDTLCNEIQFAIKAVHYRLHFRRTQVPKYPNACAYHVKHSICMNLNFKKAYLLEQETTCWYDLVLCCFQIHQYALRYCPELFCSCPPGPQTGCYVVHTITVLSSTLISFILPLCHLEH